jgi:hypothetical protein
MINFGAGKLIAVPTLDALGNPVANPTPVAVAVLQDVSVDLDYEIKTIHGEKQFPVAAGRGKGKITWKAKAGDFSAGVLGSLFLGSPAVASRKGVVVDFAATVPASPATVTIDPPGDGTFVADLGVTDVVTGKPLQRVAAAAETGQYSVNPSTGIYTFATADANKPVLFSYEYQVALSASSQLFTIHNHLMGYTPTFSAIFYNQFAGKTLAMKLNSNVLGKLSLPFKNDDFTTHDMDAEAFADASGSLGYICQY